jgi:hypothetical protein
MVQGLLLLIKETLRPLIAINKIKISKARNIKSN